MHRTWSELLWLAFGKGGHMFDNCLGASILIFPCGQHLTLSSTKLKRHVHKGTWSQIELLISRITHKWLFCYDDDSIDQCLVARG